MREQIMFGKRYDQAPDHQQKKLTQIMSIDILLKWSKNWSFSFLKTIANAINIF